MKVAVLRKELTEGNMDCLEFIFKNYSAYCIERLVRFRGCPRPLAEDLFVDAVLNFREKVLRKEIEFLTNLRGYMYSTCVNMYKAAVQKRQRQQEKASDIGSLIYNDQSDHESRIIEIETQQELNQLAVSSMAELNESCQKILRYFYVYHLSMQEIADRMGLASRHVAKTKRSRCYKKWLEIVRSYSRFKV